MVIFVNVVQLLILFLHIEKFDSEVICGSCSYNAKLNKIPEHCFLISPLNKCTYGCHAFLKINVKHCYARFWRLCADQIGLLDSVSETARNDEIILSFHRAGYDYINCGTARQLFRPKNLKGIYADVYERFADHWSDSDCRKTYRGKANLPENELPTGANYSCSKDEYWENG